jgi:hypothetical protein
MTPRAITPLLFALLLALAGSARAAGPPPSIDDLDGATFVIRAQVTEYDLAGSDAITYTVEITTTLTKTSPTTVSMTSVFGGQSSTSHYVDGLLIQAVDFEPGSPSTSATLTQAKVSGKPGKLKLRGTLHVYDLPPPFQVLRLSNLSGKQITP